MITFIHYPYLFSKSVPKEERGVKYPEICSRNLWIALNTKIVQERFVQQRRGMPNVVERAVGAAL